MPTPRVVAAILLLSAATIAHGRVIGDGKGPAGSDCFIALDGFDIQSVTAFGPKRMPAIECTDCDPRCDADGAAAPNGACGFSIGACVNVPESTACSPARLGKARAFARTKPLVDLSPAVPADASLACGVRQTVPVKTRKKGTRTRGGVPVKVSGSMVSGGGVNGTFFDWAHLSS